MKSYHVIFRWKSAKLNITFESAACNSRKINHSPVNGSLVIVSVTPVIAKVTLEASRDLPNNI